MNRVILIGNGFDLAHGMKTSYQDFLNDFWKNTVNSVRKSEGKEIYEDEFIIVKNVPTQWLSEISYDSFTKDLERSKTKIEFKNIFLNNVSEKNCIQNWVDIENEYYELLKNSIDKKDNIDYSIYQLNKDFSKVKDLLIDYLIKVERDFDSNIGPNVFRIKYRINESIFSAFKMRDFTEASFNIKCKEEFKKYQTNAKAFETRDIDQTDLTKKQFSLIQNIGTSASYEKFKKFMLETDAYLFFELLPDNTLILNFNYTFTDTLYEFPKHDEKWKGKSFDSIHIHGSNRKEDKNPVIFGFGDELDENYKKIENLNDNEYLENIKSIKYLEIDNYKRLLEFINNGNYQVFLMGHSCGVSDRTLLNTIFESENCVSIKAFYHDKGYGVDNFNDIIKNISRNFNNKAVMRDKVVNKTFSRPLV